MSGGDIRYRVERIALALMATSGVVVLLADLLGWLDALAPGGALPKVTLLILSTVTVFLLLEIDRLRKLDVVQAQVTSLDETVQTRITRLDTTVEEQVARLDGSLQEQVARLDDTVQEQVARLDDTVQAQVARLDRSFQAQLAKLDIDTVAQQLKQENYLGVVRVHAHFPDTVFNGFVEEAAQEVVILQTWMPNLEQLQTSLEKALVNQRVPVRILLLHPASPVAGLRDEALRTVRDPAFAVDVQASVRRCLAGLAELHRAVREEDRGLLQVRVYNSLPSIAVHKVDEHFLVSSFLHAQLAIDSAQLEIDGSDSTMGRQVLKELDTLWGIGHDVVFPDWRESIRARSL
ncbi:hypothetical protein J7F03_29170 [Streptomyces sp. ISL-43]|uniref:hypothetical protein n=1 Tax=Streptomyces sp. ISL-43 TaxID=2819183 RepID=UPI001BE66170|nr:hypothetical protein [Streptomyces sp. ISL-43]MBT2451075.1 hypothetical protein [Streptomyces sp. ISL-43]